MSKIYATNKKAKERTKEKGYDPFKKTKCGSGCACSVEKKSTPAIQQEQTTK